MPQWVGDDGFPLSYRHYMYGMKYINRAKAREMMELASAVRAAGATVENYKGWRSEMQEEAF